MQKESQFLYLKKYLPTLSLQERIKYTEGIGEEWTKIIDQENVLVDRDFNLYRTVKIGTQVWMADNLNVATFRNGDPIPEVKDKEEWLKAGEEGRPACCYYDNDSSKGFEYGKLYNWYAVDDERGLAPEGLHIPNELEWDTLVDYSGDDGNKMKSIYGWKKNTGTNTSGFSGLPGGYRNLGVFDSIGYNGIWWSSVEYSSAIAWNRNLNFSNGRVNRKYGYTKGDGLSDRCLRD
jgi:uncharacterized protein (TIGR02145 family)